MGHVTQRPFCIAALQQAGCYTASRIRAEAGAKQRYIFPMSPADRVLIVDDDAETRALLQAYLEKQGYRVTAVADDRSLRKALDTVVPDLIVLDLMLPGRDGLEICRDLRARSNLPVIMLTARGERSEERRVGKEC